MHMSSDSQLSDLPSDADVAVDTSAGSILHHYLAGPKPVGPGALYFGAGAITFLPLPIAESVSGTLLPWSPHTLPFLYDANVLFMFLVSFPCLLILTVTDESVLTEALRTVRADGTVTIEEADWISIRKIWRGRFRVAHWGAQVVGVIVGGVIAYINFLVYVPSDMPFWIAHEGHLLPVGFVFLYCIFAFYALVPIYVIRNIVISLLLRDLAVNSKLQMLPLHPDKCGGLRPVGQLGLRNQYALTLLGLNIVILVGVSSYFLDLRSGL